LSLEAGEAPFHHLIPSSFLLNMYILRFLTVPFRQPSLVPHILWSILLSFSLKSRFTQSFHLFSSVSLALPPHFPFFQHDVSSPGSCSRGYICNWDISRYCNWAYIVPFKTLPHTTRAWYMMYREVKTAQRITHTQALALCCENRNTVSTMCYTSHLPSEGEFITFHKKKENWREKNLVWTSHDFP
jgi:hypothetical protein